jgi:hypothetical protein
MRPVPRRELVYEITTLRTALQACESRARLAIQALDAYEARFVQLALPTAIVDASELIARIEAIRGLLAGGEVAHV